MIQTAFLDALITQGIKVTIYLRNGVGINGRLCAHDAFSLQVELNDGNQCLVYKSEISNLKASQRVSWGRNAQDTVKPAPEQGGATGGRFNIYRRGRNAARS